MCNLVAPCPERDVRVAPALLFGGMMLAPLAAVILMSVVRSPVGWLVSLSYVALVLLAVVGYVVISFSGGFGVDAAWLIGLLATGGTAVLAYVGTVALRRETAQPPIQIGSRRVSTRRWKAAIAAVVLVLAVGMILFAHGVDSADSRVLKCSTPNDSRTFTPVCP